MKTVYVKFFRQVNESVYSTQSVAKVLSEDDYGNVTVELKVDSKIEIRVLRPDQFSITPYLMDFN